MTHLGKKKLNFLNDKLTVILNNSTLLTIHTLSPLLMYNLYGPKIKYL